MKNCHTIKTIRSKANISILIFLFIFQYGNAQIECAMPESLKNELEGSVQSSSIHCFDVDHVINNCTTIYLNVNVSFFLDDDCEGDLSYQAGLEGTQNLNPSNAFNLADALINDANQFLINISENEQWNQQINGADETEAACVPIQYVLNGVYIHCSSEFQNNSGTQAHEFAVNQDTEINVFIGNLDFSYPGTGPNGWGPGDIYVENFNAGLFNHEMGHVFGLSHTFHGHDGCSDLWDDEWEWDSDCDGNIDLDGVSCWSSEPVVDNPNTPENDPVDGCDSDLFCENHPCCEWSAQNNNVMTYSGWAGNSNYAAFTPCQVNEMITHIAENMCDYIEDIGGCPPPKASIGIIPTLDSEEDCPTCFYLAGSFNEYLYELTLTDESGEVIYNTGHIFNEASKYCIYPNYDKYGRPYWPNGMKAGDRLTLTLLVENECGDFDEVEHTFVLPRPCMNQIPQQEKVDIIIKSISPNPAIGANILLQFDVVNETDISIYGIHQATAKNYGQVARKERFRQGVGKINIDVSYFRSGINFLIVETDNSILVETIIKE